ncbi:hypothetical protein HAX54_004322, partial [Datura stramonium]|nr:hypothetical protein [Datura stramonium]
RPEHRYGSSNGYFPTSSRRNSDRYHGLAVVGVPPLQRSPKQDENGMLLVVGVEVPP